MSKLALPTVPAAGLFKQGSRTYESEDGVVQRSVAAVREIAGMIRTSVGPAGRNKIIVNSLQKVFLTADASTILRELDVVHPACKLVVMASQQQEAEYGDASNLVVVLAGELLAQAEELLRVGMSASEIAHGFGVARAHALAALAELEVPERDVPLEVVLRSVISSRQFGYEELLEPLVAEAVRYVLPEQGHAFNVDNVRVVKIMGAALPASRVVKGMVFPTRPEGSVQTARAARAALFTAPFDISQTETKGTVLLNNAQEMLAFSKGEEAKMDEFVRSLKADADVSVVVCGAGLGALALHYLNKHGILAFRVASKFDLLRLGRVTGAALLPTLRLPEPHEVGHIDSVQVEEIGGDHVTVFRQEARRARTATIVLRGATQSLLDDVERAIDDGVAAVKSLVKGAALVPGAGAAEIAVAAAVYAQGERTPGVQQHAVKAYAKAFEVVPRTLASNAGLDDSEVVARLYAQRQPASLDPAKNPAPGVDVEAESVHGVLDAKAAGIWDIAIAKRSAIELATEAACTVLTVDQIIMAKRAGGPAMPKQGGDWDQD